MTPIIMNLKFDVIPLNREIAEKKPDFLIMNSDTSNSLDIANNGNFARNLCIQGYYAQYRGVPIAICDKLKYGEVFLV